MHATRLLPVLALLVFLPARADDGAAAKAATPADAKKADTSMSCCAGEDTQLCPKAKEATAKPAPAGAASMVVTKDPVTGKLRPPTAEEMRELNALRPQAAPVAPQIVVLPNGTRMIKLGPESTSYAIARRNPDGSLTQVCVEGAEAAAAAQQPPAPPPPPRKEER